MQNSLSSRKGIHADARSNGEIERIDLMAVRESACSRRFGQTHPADRWPRCRRRAKTGRPPSASGTAPVSMNGKSRRSGYCARYCSKESKWRTLSENAAPIDARTTRGSSESTAGRMIAMFLRPKPSAVRRMCPDCRCRWDDGSRYGLSSSNRLPLFINHRRKAVFLFEMRSSARSATRGCPRLRGLSSACTPSLCKHI